ncbi:MAG: hypothetical protein V1808_00830 [Candidatus Daviesbacteria bacterium]
MFVEGIKSIQKSWARVVPVVLIAVTPIYEGCVHIPDSGTYRKTSTPIVATPTPTIRIEDSELPSLPTLLSSSSNHWIALYQKFDYGLVPSSLEFPSSATLCAQFTPDAFNDEAISKLRIKGYADAFGTSENGSQINIGFMTDVGGLIRGQILISQNSEKMLLYEKYWPRNEVTPPYVFQAKWEKWRMESAGWVGQNVILKPDITSYPLLTN